MPPTLRRPHDVLATNLLFAGFLLGSLVDFYTRTGVYGPPPPGNHLSPTAHAISSGIFLVFILVHFYYIRRGYRWAKILFFICLALSMLLYTRYSQKTVDTQFSTPLKSVSFVIQWLLEFLATALLVVDLWKYRKGTPPAAAPLT